MKTLKKPLFFIITYNIIFIFILNLQYIVRFNKQDSFAAMLMYSSFLSISYSIIPVACFIFSWFISKSITTQNTSSVLKSMTLLLMTVISTYTPMELIVGEPIFTSITISTIMLTLLLFFFKYRKTSILSNG